MKATSTGLAYFDRKINQVAVWFDGLFGDTARQGTEKADIKLQWTNELRAEEGESVKYRSSLHAHLHLPRLEKKIRLAIMEETRKEAVVPIPIDPGTPVANTPTNTNNLRALNTELRYYVRDTKTGYAFLAVGSRFVWLPETFVRARFLWRHTLSDNTFISPSVTPFWQDHIGFGITPQMDFGHPFARDYPEGCSFHFVSFSKARGRINANRLSGPSPPCSYFTIRLFFTDLTPPTPRATSPAFLTL